MKRRTIVTLTGLVLISAGVVSAHLAVKSVVHRLVNVSVEFGSDLEEELSQERFEARVQNLDAMADLDPASPFQEIDPFGEEAMDWSCFFDAYAPTGVLVFDANGDGKQDVYFCRHGDSWVRPTDEKGVLVDNPRPQFNSLFLNQGNDASGNPIFKLASELAQSNDTHVAEELLIENFLQPRTSTEDDPGRVGRISSVAIAPDLNADGRPDLVVGNMLPGMLWSHPKTQRVLGQFVRPVGRQAVRTKRPLSALGLCFLHDYVPTDDMESSRESARGMEAVGANSVFLNLGDQDGDGLPEWRDVSRECGLEGKRNTLSLLAADFDLDGDIDLFEANIMDMDFWPGGSTNLAGAANQLYLNQLAETGELRFREASAEFEVDGLYDENNPVPTYHRLSKLPLLPEEYSILLRRFESYQPDFLEINQMESEPGQISWASVVQDANDDGYPDIWIANDLGFLRLYLNEEGKKFRLSTDHPRANQTGYWMSFCPGDFNGDRSEDLFAGNVGGAAMNLATPIPDLYMLFDPVISSATMAQQFFGKSHWSMHALYDGSDITRDFTGRVKVRHSEVMPPDASLENNIRSFVVAGSEHVPFDRDGLDPYEFTWGSTTVDIQNDGRLDLYWVGCLQGRGGGTFPIMGTGPGRLLVNATMEPDKVRFADMTGEHRLFNIHELQYDRLESEGYIYRKSPLQNWGKRSVVTSDDVSVWGFHGPGVTERITNRDLIQASENGRAAVSADLNGDGFADILVRNIGGYDSRGSDAVNLKARIGDKVAVIPAHDANFPSPTNYEPGSTRTFINTYGKNNWVKISLLDDSEGSFNRNAIGARVEVNDTFLQVQRCGNGGFISNRVGPLLFGLGADPVSRISVVWPDKERTVTEIEVPGVKNELVIISKTRGLIRNAEVAEAP